MLLAELVNTSAQASPPRPRRKVEPLVGYLRRLAAEVRARAAYLAGQLPQRRDELGWASLAAVAPPPADRPALDLLEVDGTPTPIPGGGGRRAT